MKRYLSPLILIITLLFFTSVFAANPTPNLGPESYTIDPNHTYVLFHINHMGFSSQVGKWFANGTLTYNAQKPQDSKLQATIDVAKIITGIDKLDEHLKGEQFFDVLHFPTATFVSNKINMAGKDTAKVAGMLTLHGITKPVTLDVKINKIGISPITQKQTIGFTARGSIKRSDFGMTAYLPGLGDEVRLHIEGEAFIANKNHDSNQ